MEDRITYVATKVVHLGDQLESSNNRRARDFEAETLMRYLAEFYATPKPTSIVFSDPGQVRMYEEKQVDPGGLTPTKILCKIPNPMTCLGRFQISNKDSSI